MSENFFDTYLNTQKILFDQWQENIRAAFASYDFSRMQNAEATTNGDEVTREFWGKVQESSKSYQAVMELWKNLSEKNTSLDQQTAVDIFDAWCKQGFTSIRASLIPNIPEYMKNFVEKSIGRMESSSNTVAEYARMWASSEDSVARAWADAQGKGPEGYIHFLKTWQQSYNATLGRLLSAPSFGKNMEFLQQQKSSFDRFIRYNIAATQFYTSLASVIREATRKVVDDYLEMRTQGTEPKTFEEFYKYWTKVVSDHYEKILFTDEISSLAGNMVNEMARFKRERDRLCEMYLADLPIPKKSDMDDLYKTVHDLKREVRRLKTELTEKTTKA